MDRLSIQVLQITSGLTADVEQMMKRSNILATARKSSAAMVMLALLIPITAPIPAWAYGTELTSSPRMTDPENALSISMLIEAAESLRNLTAAAFSSLVSAEDKPDGAANTKVTVPAAENTAESEARGPAADREAVKARSAEALSIAAPASKPAPVSSAALTVNQLPVDEQESVYSHENNLGSPPGQTEMDSPNTSAAISIRHRAGTANYSFGVPLASLPGRGIDAGVALSYNSRTWNKSQFIDPNTQTTISRFTYDVEQSWIAPGFSSGFGYLASKLISRPVVMMDGTNTEVKTLTEIIPDGIIEADGTRRQIACKTYSQVLGGHPSATYCSAFETTDGSFIRVSRSGSSYSVNGTVIYANTNFSIAYANGTKSFFGGPFGSGNYRKHFPYVVQDRNGNRIRIAYKADQSGRIDYISDTINRKIKYYYEDDSNGDPDKLIAVTIPGTGVDEEIQTVRFYYEDMTLDSADAFGGLVTSHPSSIRVLRYIYIPGSRTGYKYDYHPNYGMIRKITRLAGMTVSGNATMTTGSVTDEGVGAATTEYDYPNGSTPLTDVPKYMKRTDDWIGRTAVSAQETYYDVPEPTTGVDRKVGITVADADFDTLTETISHNTGDWKNGLVRETSVSKMYGARHPFTNQRPNRLKVSKTVYIWTQGSGSIGGRENPILQKIEVTNDRDQTKATKFEYDQYNNQTKIQEYDFAAPGTLGTLLKTTDIGYETGSGWINANLLGLPTSVITSVGGIAVSKSLIEYDHGGNDSSITTRSDMDTGTHSTFYNPGYPARTETFCPNGDVLEGDNIAPPDGCVTIHHSGYTAASAYRGNVTKVTTFSDATLTTDPLADVNEYDYDIAGNPVSATLSCCQLKTIDYGSSFSVTGYAYPVRETKGSSPGQLINELAYDKNTGLVTSSTDENGQVTTFEYEPDTLRQSKVTYPNGGYVETEYSDKIAPSVNDLVPGFIRQTTTLESNKLVESYSYFDGRGLGIRSAAETPDGWSISAVEYDQLGRARKTYDPFYASTPTAAIPGGTKYTELVGLDALGRATQVTMQDGTSVFSHPNEAAVTVTYPDSTQVVGTASRQVDQADKERRRIVDSLGRIVRVDEPTANGLGSASAPNQPTYYQYDGNDNLAEVIQSDGTATQERRFKYDSMSRLVAEKQVEANPTLDAAGVHGSPDPSKWTKVLKYDAQGRLSQGIDARGISTTFGYDGLNRVEDITYSDGTPTVVYTYDQARTDHFNNGKLTRVETVPTQTTPAGTMATATEFDYDLMGRVSKHRQTIGGQTYNIEYGYNLAGQLTSQKYPSGKTVTTSYDAGGRLSEVADQTRSFVTGMQYQGKANSLSQMALGNGTVETFALNDRLQLASQELKRGTEVLQKYAYGYGRIDPNGNLDTAKNNGQLATVESHIGTAKQWTQKFTYDHVGRLGEAAEYRGDTNALSYKQKFDFDRFGNMYRKAAGNPTTGQATPLPYTPIEDGDISKSTNRFTSDTTYDDAGNVVADDKFREMGFAYDANGRMIKATAPNVPDALSVYDASGMRVAEKVNDVWRYLVYDIGGKLVAEYGGPPATDQGGIKYVLQDWQGSTRASVSVSGYIKSRTDFTAFGEEIGAGTGLRTGAQGFGTANRIRQKYGLTERDDATGLDHTWFRKNEGRAGRWTSPDPYNGSMRIGDPQSFNRYSYVQNDPANYIDPSGLTEEEPGVIRIDTWVPGIDGRFWWYMMFGGWSGSSGGHSESGGGVRQTGEQVYIGCANSTWGNSRSNAPGFEQAMSIRYTARVTGVSATLLAVTVRKEGGSDGSVFLMNPINNGNDGTSGNVDIGPAQINFNTWANSSVLEGTDLDLVFGTNHAGGEVFNGNFMANIGAAAQILSSLSGDDRNKAGRYRTGEGRFSRTKIGQAAYNARVAAYDSLKPQYDKFFSCLEGGLRRR